MDDNDGYNLNLVGGTSKKKQGPKILELIQPRPRRNGAYTITPFSEKRRRPRFASKDPGTSYRSQESSTDETGALLNTSYNAAVDGTITTSTHPVASLDRNPRPLIRQGHARNLSSESTYSLPMSLTMSVTSSRASTEREREGSIDPYWLTAREAGDYEPSMLSEKSRRTMGSPQSSITGLPLDRDIDIAPILRKERLNQPPNLNNPIPPVVRVPENPASPPRNVSTPTQVNAIGKQRMNPPNYASVVSTSPPPAPSRELSPFMSSPSRVQVPLQTLQDFVEHPRVIHQTIAPIEPPMTDLTINIPSR